jgi:predicted permease
MRDDLRTAVRALRAAPGFTLAALAVLTLGIGASTAIFSVVDAVVLRGLPFADADRLISVSETNTTRAGLPGGSSAPQNFLDWKAQQDVFEGLAATSGTGGFAIRDGGPPEELRAIRATANLFQILRVRPTIGQPFTERHEIEGNHRVMLISDALWRRRFHADPNVVGRTMTFDSGAWQVVGVMDPEFRYPIGATRATDLWVPYVVPEDDRVRGPGRSYYLQVVGRLKPGVTLEQARARMDQITASLAAAHPNWFRDRGIATEPLHDFIVGPKVKSWMLMLLGAVAFVLLISCVNVANLMLARATTRGREVAIRGALGASRWRLARTLLVESLVLSLAGAALGVLVAYWAIEILRASLPASLPQLSSVALDLRVLAAAAAAAIGTGVVFGLVPSLQGARASLTAALREGGRSGTASLLRQQLRSMLVGAEVALAAVLLAGAGLFIASFARLMSIDVGLDYRNVLTLPVYMRINHDDPGARGAGMAAAQVKTAEILERVRAIPGVEAASLFSGGLPLSSSWSRTSVQVPGREQAFEGESAADIRQITPDYTRVIRQPLIRGRLFTDADTKDAPGVVLLSEVAARLYFDGRDPIGQKITINGDRTVVGVVGDIRLEGPEKDARPQAFTPWAQGSSAGGDLVIRTTGNPLHVVSAVRHAVQAVLPDLVVPEAQTFEAMFDRIIAQRKFNMLLLSLFGLLGAVIAAAGIYGVMAFVVEQRRTEFGVRMALGAERRRILLGVLRRAAFCTAAGLTVGLSIAVGLSFLIRSFLFEVQPADPLVFAAIAALLVTIALLAALVPALRASRVDPIAALRAE